MMDSKANLKESAGVPTTTTTSTLGPPSLSVGNHLDIPQNNPNLLSPDVLSQRRGLPTPQTRSTSQINYFFYRLVFPTRVRKQEAEDHQSYRCLICLPRRRSASRARTAWKARTTMKARTNWTIPGARPPRRLREYTLFTLRNVSFPLFSFLVLFPFIVFTF